LHSDGEKNLLFIGVTIVSLILLIGIALVDGSLNRLIVPDRPFATASIKYNHGIVWVSQEKQVAVKAPRLANLQINQNQMSLETRLFKLELPLVISIKLLGR